MKLLRVARLAISGVLWFFLIVHFDWLADSQASRQSADEIELWTRSTLVCLAATAAWLKLSWLTCPLVLLADVWLLRLLGPLATPLPVPIVLIVLSRAAVLWRPVRFSIGRQTGSLILSWVLAFVSLFACYLVSQYREFPRGMLVVLVWAESVGIAGAYFGNLRAVPLVLAIGCWPVWLVAARLPGQDLIFPLACAAGILCGRRFSWNRRRLTGVLIATAVCALSLLIDVERYGSAMTIFWAGVWAMVYGYFFLDSDEEIAVHKLSASDKTLPI